MDKAMELDHLGGTYGGNRKPTPFMCLVMKMLQIQPEKEIIIEFIKNEDYKYVRILGAFYLRITGSDIDVYRYLEPLYNDYRKLRRKLADGRWFPFSFIHCLLVLSITQLSLVKLICCSWFAEFALTHVDEVIDELLTKDYSCDIAMPRVKKRYIFFIFSLFIGMCSFKDSSCCVCTLYLNLSYFPFIYSYNFEDCEIIL